MKVAVVILNWNGVSHLCRFLPSVVSRTADADIIVADNGSTDESVEVVEREFPSVGIVRLDRNYGFAEGYNRSLGRLHGYDLYVLLNSDVEPDEGWLAPLVEVMEQESDVAAVGPKILSLAERDRFEYAGASGGYIDYFGYPFCRGRILEVTERDEGQYDDRRDLFWVSGAAFCCRAEVFEALGGFCGDFFAHMEEIDLCWRMQLAGWRVAVEPRSRVWHLGGGTLQTSSPQKRFYNHRNNLAMLFRCASPMQRVVVAVARPLLDLAAALSYGAGGDWASAKAVWRAYRDFFAWHRRLSHERCEIQRAAVARSRYIYNGIVPLRYLLGWRKFDKLM